MTSIHIPDLFQTIVGKVNAVFSTRVIDPFPVFFDYGHYVEVTRNLTQKDASISQKDKKYPLIWLVMDFDEDFGSIDDGYCDLPALQILITVPTQPAITTPERVEKNFRPRLYPIYDELINQIFQSGLFQVINPENIKHRRTLRPYWGGQDSQGNGTANLFNDFIDAIQIRNLQLKVNESVCDTFNILNS